MKIIKPVITEKTVKDAENGQYTFLVDPKLNKFQIKKLIADVFDVTVDSVKTMNYKPRIKRNFRREKVHVSGEKKAVVTLKGKDKIDIFEEAK